MSDETQGQGAQPDPTPTPKARPSKPMTVAQVAQAIAKAKKTDQGTEAKKLRGHIRANFDTLSKQWPALKASQKANRDGNRYPPMPAKLAKSLIKSRTAGK